MPSGVAAMPMLRRGEGLEPDGESVVHVIADGLKRKRSLKTANKCEASIQAHAHDDKSLHVCEINKKRQM